MTLASASTSWSSISASSTHTWSTATMEPSPFDGTLKVKLETPKRLGATVTVRRELMEDDRSRQYALRRVHDDLRLMLDRQMEQAGRMQVPGTTPTIQQHEDLAMDALVFRATVDTLESTKGEWASIWAAIHQDEEDRREVGL